MHNFDILSLPLDRELAKQTCENIALICNQLKHDGYPELRTVLAIGGMPAKEQAEIVRRKGVHIVVATPGRLMDMLNKKMMTLDVCRYVPHAACEKYRLVSAVNLLLQAWCHCTVG